MRLRSFEIKGFYGASFEQGIKCDNLGHINVLIGPNNSGKSIPSRVFSLLGGAAQIKVIELLQSFQGRLATQGYLFHHLATKNRYQQRGDQPLSVTIEVNMESSSSIQHSYLLTDTACAQSFVNVEIKFWNFDNGYFVSCNPLIQLAEGSRKRHWLDQRTTETARSNMVFYLDHSGNYGSQGQAFAREWYSAIRETQEELKKVRFFEPKRDLESNAAFTHFNPTLNDRQAFESQDERLISERHISGANILEKLASLQNSDENADKAMLSDIAKTMNEILTPSGNIGFHSLHITEKDGKDKRKLQLIGADSSVVSFENFGTGISALVILLAELLINKSPSAYFLEEPEQHLHPGLLARLVQFLKSKCKHHQFVISTHSNTLLDCIDSGDRVYRFSQTKESGCVAEACTSFTDYHLLFDSLGIRASSLMLVNNVIWVEGPSDVTYLRFWLSQYRFGADGKQALTENSDFAFVMYGGSCISYLCADEEEEPDKLSILRLCRRAILVADKDSDNEDERKVHVERLAAEFKDSPGRKLITTANREIENDVDRATLVDALKLTFTRSLKDFPFEKLQPDNTVRLPELIKAAAAANLFEIKIKQGNDFSDTFNNAKTRLASNVVELLRKQEAVAVPDYIKELAEFILAGRAPDAVVFRSS